MTQWKKMVTSRTKARSEYKYAVGDHVIVGIRDGHLLEGRIIFAASFHVPSDSVEVLNVYCDDITEHSRFVIYRIEWNDEELFDSWVAQDDVNGLFPHDV